MIAFKLMVFPFPSFVLRKFGGRWKFKPTWRPIQDDTTFPRDRQAFVRFLGVEESGHFLPESRFGLLVEDGVVPVCCLNLQPEIVILGPISVREDEDFFRQFQRPGASSFQELIGRCFPVFTVAYQKLLVSAP